MRKILILALIITIVPLCAILAFGFMKQNHIYLESGSKGVDVVVLKSYLKINPIDENFDNDLTQKVMIWQEKYNSTSQNKIKSDGKIRKENLLIMNLSVNDSYDSLFDFSIVKNARYNELLEKAYALNYKGYTDVSDYILKRIPKADLKPQKDSILLYDIKVMINGAKYIDNKAYATQADIRDALYTQTVDPANSYLLRIFPEEKNYQNYIKFTDDLVKSKYKIDNLDSVFLRRIAAFLRDNKKTVIFSEGFRTYSDQEKLFKRFPERSVPPSTSWHEYSVAVDVLGSKIAECMWLKELYNVNPTDNQTTLLKYGIFKPYTSGNKNEILRNSFKDDDAVIAEDWHIQPIETRFDANQSNYKGQ